MAKLEIKYRLEGKALPPRPIRVQVPGWGGSPAMKRENGSEPQPWHCPLFVDGCTRGAELLYHFDTEVHVINENGRPRFEMKEGPENEIGPNDFTFSLPPPPTDYLLATSLDIQVPPGYLVRTETHPRFFRDHSGTVPSAFCGNIQSAWWPKKLFVVFKVPGPGQRHIFRKGEPYAQILFVPQDDFALSPMTDEEQESRRKLEADIKLCKSLIAKNVWNSASGVEFNDHYKVLSRAYAQDGMAGVEAIVREGIARYHDLVPEGKSAADYIDLAKLAQAKGELAEAKEILHHVVRVAPESVDAHLQLSALAWQQNVPSGALRSMQQVVALRPDSAEFRFDLGSLYHRLGRLEDAQRELEESLRLKPGRPQVLTFLGMILSQRGIVAEAVAHCRAAAEADPKAAGPHYVMGLTLAQAGRVDAAREALETALMLEPKYEAARQALSRLGSTDAKAPSMA